MGERYKTHSVIKPSILNRYVMRGDFDTPECVACFNNEVLEALRLYPVGVVTPRRRESIRPFILKVLIHIGIAPGHYNYGLIAKIIERLAVHPGTGVSDLIADIASKTGISVMAIAHNIDSNFDINNSMTYERVTSLTKTKPLTARDMLVDIAQYVRYSILIGESPYA